MQEIIQVCHEVAPRMNDYDQVAGTTVTNTIAYRFACANFVKLSHKI